MQLSENGLNDRGKWEAAGYRLPKFDRIKVQKKQKAIRFGFTSEPEIFSGHSRQM